MNLNQLSMLWEIPLGILSFIFYHLLKFIIGNVYTLYLALNRKQAKQWRVLSQESLQTPLSLPVLMTKAPRWNTHAIIGTLGPIVVKESLAFDLTSLQKSAQSWIGAIYSFPDYQTVGSFSDVNISKTTQEWQSVKLKPGKYTVGLRYYQCSNQVVFPQVKVDEKTIIDSVATLPDINNFYYNLSQQKNWFYLALHYYIYPLLNLRKWLPESFVKQEFLPVGAPYTQFFYHYLPKDTSLRLDIEPTVITNYDIYFTLYDRASFPVVWAQIQTETYITSVCEQNSFYLLRVRLKNTQIIQSGQQLKLTYQLKADNDLVQQLQITGKYELLAGQTLPEEG